MVIQNLNGQCNGIANPLIRKLQERNSYIMRSHAEERTYYERSKNCVMTLIGKLGYQWEIRINSFDVYGETDSAGNPTKCYDYVKFYDSERVDNAKLLKGINYETGLCGTLTPSTVGQLLFRTCANILTIQFYTLDTQKGSSSEFRQGFGLELIQYEWTNPTGGPDCDFDLNGIAPGMWRDGTFSEFQNSWTDQPVIPGYISGGAEANYDKEIAGITCYVCQNCPVEPFDPVRDATGQDTNCYRCSKEWDQEYQIAKRACYTRTNYLNFIDSIREIDEPFIGCRQSVDQYSRTRNYCFCDTDLCNWATRFTWSKVTLCLVGLVSLLHRLLI